MRSSTPLLDYARLDPGLMGGGRDGVSLFRPLPRRGRKHARRAGGPVEIDTEFDGRLLHVVSPFVLGADDLAILLALLAVAGESGGLVRPEHEPHRARIASLDSGGEAASRRHITAKASRYRILQQAGIEDGGRGYDTLTAALERLYLVSYIDRGPVGANSRSSASGERLLSRYRAGQHDDDIDVTINARFAAAILGGQDGGDDVVYRRLDLMEHRTLRSEAARILHLLLTLQVREGRREPQAVGHLDDLAARIYGAPADYGRRKLDRRAEVRAALVELGGLAGWSVNVDKRNKVTVLRRPKPANSPHTPASSPQITASSPQLTT